MSQECCISVSDNGNGVTSGSKKKIVRLIFRTMVNNKPAQSNDVPDMSSMVASRIIWAMQPTRSFLRWSDDLHMIFVKAVAYQGGPHGLAS